MQEMNDADAIDTLSAERFSALGDMPLVLLPLDDPSVTAQAGMLAARTQAIVIGIDRTGALPAIDPAPFDTLLTLADSPPTPWVGIPATKLDARLAHIEASVRQAPIAASLCMRTLKIGEGLRFDDALHLESLAYSTLLGGAEFRHWLDARAPQPAPPPPDAYVATTREDDRLTITLTNPQARNGICAAMRDALFEALAAAIDDPTCPQVLLDGAGGCFSTGGVLGEFGTARDLAQAHLVRTLRSCAGLLHRLGDRATARLHRACIGSGIEIPAAAARRIGSPDAFFQLPELSMGLMPGAGGTVSLPRAIGRHRAAYMMLTGERIRAKTARDWGLLHAIEPV